MQIIIYYHSCAILSYINHHNERFLTTRLLKHYINTWSILRLTHKQKTFNIALNLVLGLYFWTMDG